jgi:hypothetical protein
MISEIESLTGYVAFDERGIRKGYSINVVDITFADESAYSTKKV